MGMRLESEAFRAHNSSLHKNKSQTITFLAGGFVWLTLDQGVRHRGLEHFCLGATMCTVGCLAVSLVSTY